MKAWWECRGRDRGLEPGIWGDSGEPAAGQGLEEILQPLASGPRPTSERSQAVRETL